MKRMAQTTWSSSRSRWRATPATSANPVRAKPAERLKRRAATASRVSSRLVSSRFASSRLASPADSGGPRSSSRGLIKTSLIIYKQSFLFAA